MLNNEDIHIRDPFVLVYDGKYYLYGSRGNETWGHCTGLDVYVSEDLYNWEEPYTVFTPSSDFWSDYHFWRRRCIRSEKVFICSSALNQIPVTVGRRF